MGTRKGFIEPSFFVFYNFQSTLSIYYFNQDLLLQVTGSLVRSTEFLQNSEIIPPEPCDSREGCEVPQ